MKDEGKAASYLAISDVSRAIGLSHKRIRDYEKAGFIKPDRDPNTNNRIYKHSDLDQIKRIHQLLHHHGFTVACLQYFLSNAPCYKIFDCHKENCPAYQDPHQLCFNVMASNGLADKKSCNTCPVYLNRKTSEIKFFEKTR